MVLVELLLDEVDPSAPALMCALGAGATIELRDITQLGRECWMVPAWIAIICGHSISRESALRGKGLGAARLRGGDMSCLEGCL